MLGRSEGQSVGGCSGLRVGGVYGLQSRATTYAHSLLEQGLGKGDECFRSLVMNYEDNAL